MDFQFMDTMFGPLQHLEFLLRVLAACLCGALIGIERNKRYKGAGIRTHMIVCVAAAMIMIVSKYGFSDLANVMGDTFGNTKVADPARLAAQVITGVSFIGAGVIFKNGNVVKGLTTSAGIWATSGIGLTIGAGMYILGGFVTLVIVAIQILMHRFTFGADALKTSHIQFTVKNTEAFRQKFEQFLKDRDATIIESRMDYSDDGYVSYDMLTTTRHGISIEDLTAVVFESDGVRSVSCVPVM